MGRRKGGKAKDWRNEKEKESRRKRLNRIKAEDKIGKSRKYERTKK